mgnify:CR=1 FL=1
MTIRTLTLALALSLLSACTGGAIDEGVDEPAEEMTFDDLKRRIERGEEGWDDDDASSFCEDLERWYDEIEARYLSECNRGSWSDDCGTMEELMGRIGSIIARDCEDDPGRGDGDGRGGDGDGRGEDPGR